MIQINLLPDIKLEYVRMRRLKRTVVLISGAVSAASLGLLVILFISVNVVRQGHLNNLDADITNRTAELKAMPDLAKVLTIQNQLNALTDLHDQKPVSSRIFTYIQQLAPKEASIDTLTVNFEENTMIIEGSAESLAGVNKFADTLKFTTYVIETDDAGASGNQRAFEKVVLTDFGISGSLAGSGKPASYAISLTFKPEIFSSNNTVKLTVPDQVTTRSVTEKPKGVFDTPTGGNR